MEVKVKNILDKKLKKAYHISIPNQLISDKIDAYIESVKEKISMKGFRKGKVPLEVIKEKYGSSIFADEADKLVSENLQKIIKDNEFKLALSPKVDVKTFEMGKDLEVEITLEIYPKVPEVDFSKIKVIRREVEISKAEVDEAFERLIKLHRNWNKQDATYKAKEGDSVVIDYVGKIDKQEFEGGSAKSYKLELGTKTFIDNFESQLVGVKEGDQVKIKVKFPKDYHNDKFSGKAAEFEVKVNEVLKSELPEITDEFIKDKFGIENRGEFEDVIKKRLESNYHDMSRSLFRKELLEFVNKKYDFDLPSGLVDEQLKEVWGRVEEDVKNNPDRFKNDKEKEKEKERLKEDAEKTVRCGIILSELSRIHKVEVTNDDLNKEIGKIFSRYPNQEKSILDYYQKNPSAINQLKSVVLEEKVIDVIFSDQSIEKKKISLKDFDKIWQKSD